MSNFMSIYWSETMILNRNQLGSTKTSTTPTTQPTGGTTTTVKSFKQTQPSDSWMISHNLGRRPNIKMYSENGVVELIGEVTHVSTNVANVLFDIPVAGIAEYS